MRIDDIVYHFAEKNDFCDEHSTYYFFIYGTFITESFLLTTELIARFDSLTDV